MILHTDFKLIENKLTMSNEESNVKQALISLMTFNDFYTFSPLINLQENHTLQDHNKYFSKFYL